MSRENLLSEIDAFCKAHKLPTLYLVGSRAYDGAYPQYNASTEKSDFDYIVPIRLIQGIRELCEKYADVSIDKAGPYITDSNYNNGFKFYIKDKTSLVQVNIIPLIDVEYRAWQHATETLRVWACQDNYIRLSLTNRNMRIGLLEQLRATYKSALAMGSVIKE